MSYNSRSEGYDARKWVENGLKRRTRRSATKWLLGFGMLLIVAFAIVQVAWSVPAAVGKVPNLMPLLVPCFLGASMSPFARAPWLTARGRASYDEFERAAYARATAIAYVAFLTMMVGAFAYLWGANSFGWPTPKAPFQWVSCGIAVLVVGAGLPLLLAEIIVPLPPTGEEW